MPKCYNSTVDCSYHPVPRSMKYTLDIFFSTWPTVTSALTTATAKGSLLSLARHLFTKSCIPDVLVHMLPMHHHFNTEHFSTVILPIESISQTVHVQPMQSNNQAWLINWLAQWPQMGMVSQNPQFLSPKNWEWPKILSLKNFVPRKFGAIRYTHKT